MKKRKRGQLGIYVNIVLCIIALAALTFCIFLLFDNYKLNHDAKEAMLELQTYTEEKESYLYTQADVDAFVSEGKEEAEEEGRATLLSEIKNRMSGGGTTSALLRDFFPENIVVFSDASYHFFPIEEKWKKNNYVYRNFVMNEQKRMDYIDDTGVIHSKSGIDVSKHQGKIDWKKVAEDGVEYAIIRVGFRGSSEGKIVEDEYFKENMEGALENHIPVGVYFYTQAKNAEEAVEEAEFLLDLIKPYKITYPVVLDIEEVEGGGRTTGMTKEEYTQASLAFLDKVEAAGYNTMIYGNLKTFLIMLDMDKIEKYEKWFAYYQTPVYFPYDFAVWQYSCSGKVDGIKGEVDLNVCMSEYH